MRHTRELIVNLREVAEENGAYRGHSAAGAAEHVIAADPDAKNSGMIALFLDGDFGVADAASAAMRRARS